MSRLEPGGDGTPVPAGASVLRLALRAVVEFKDFGATGRVRRTAFDLSSADEGQPVPRLSVFVEGLTSVEQAWSFLDFDPRYGYSLHLGVDGIRAVRPDPDDPSVPSLDVQWEGMETVDAQTGVEVPDARPGASGHAGITGLARREGVNRAHTKALKEGLARIAVARALPAVPQSAGEP